MGTSAIVKVIHNNQVISNVLTTSDGYLDSLGNLLLSVLKRKHVNGYTNDQTQYNRVGNFIALIVAKLVIKSTESKNRVNEFFKKPRNKDLSCGGCEIISNEYSSKLSTDYEYTIEFDCDNQEPKPPLITVKSYDFISDKLSVNQFEELILNGIPE